ncbi:unnamed protein product [Caenorhabditis auriculariae]|uniref:Transmembrane protein 53 n=1 Tax=Caenorhabditis auriculariae TaxID=2777116 RepID=A0A8S1GP96_9PELO|nr:unnamed protein product [Caenorhabditis auriculariae]
MIKRTTLGAFRVINSGPFLGPISQQKRCFLTRHVPETRMVIHALSAKEGDETKTIVLSDAAVDEKKPVVLILGWAGALQRHIDKYAEIYTSQGYRVVSLTPPCYTYRIPNSRIGFYISPLFRAVDAKPGDFRTYDKCPIVVHSMSMNGIRALASFWKWTEVEQRTDLRERIKGIIFDSAPSRCTGKQEAVGMVVSTPPLEGFHGVSHETRIKVVSVWVNFRNAIAIPLSATVPFLRSMLSLFYYMIDKMKLPRDQLFLYSSADDMVKAKNVEKFMKAQVKKGANVDSVNFGDSAHVRHFSDHPLEYRQKCLQFVRHIEAVYK